MSHHHQLQSKSTKTLVSLELRTESTLITSSTRVPFAKRKVVGTTTGEQRKKVQMLSISKELDNYQTAAVHSDILIR